ncbi:MAG: tyrosine--tRNA ligase [Bacteroidales bacterium]|nr:tyrosine--tRNA ligase [Bacteroidota bacterium]MBL6950239.1 tyrosine--tRNA ligase [Bacteroidales bacterium]
MNFIEELRWRGMIHDMTPGTEEQLQKEMTSAYIGYDPTSDSLHIGNLASIMMLVHLQQAGHKPIALIGGATGMIGDPAGKSEERNLLDENVLRYNQQAIKTQLEKFLDFDCGKNSAEMVNNYDWTKEFGLLEFLRDVGKHLTVNYMVAKDSVKNRMDSGSGISFAEFSYQLVQGYDFCWLYENKQVKLQMGGSDQWGNIVTGTELIRRKLRGEAYALTCPLITKSDGGKFGKTEEGNIWLDPERTSPYKFYQFWLNTSDEDAVDYIKTFTMLSEAEIDLLVKNHVEAPHLRILQKALAKDITIRVHSEAYYSSAVEASEILFGKGTTGNLLRLPENILLSVFEGVPQYEVAKREIVKSIPIVEFLTEYTGIFTSKGEARRMLKDNGVSINKQKVDSEFVVGTSSLLQDVYILVQKGKKNYFLVKTV